MVESPLLPASESYRNMVNTLGHKIFIDIKHMFTTSERGVPINGTHLTE
jgi:hypothetical protein